MSSVAQRIRDILVEQLGVDATDVAPAASLVEDLGADSLDVVELVMALEEEFGVEISDEEAECLRRVGDLSDYISRRAATR